MGSVKKAYICFDYDHDLDIKEALVAQSAREDSPFKIKDVSIKQAINENSNSVNLGISS